MAGRAGKRFIREREWFYGDRLDVDIYTVTQRTGKRRKRCKPTRQIQKILNERNSRKRMERIANLNFTEKDMALHLTYRPDCLPESEEAAARDFDNFIRRVRYRVRKAGAGEIKYLHRMQYGRTGGRLHHHVIITGCLDRDTMERLWVKGYANSKRLQFDNGSLAALTEYMGRDGIGYRRWNGSRNLIQPEPLVSDGKITVGQMEGLLDLVEGKKASLLFEEVFSGYIMEDAVTEYIDTFGQRYIRVSMRRRCGGKTALPPPAPVWRFLEGVNG